MRAGTLIRPISRLPGLPHQVASFGAGLLLAIALSACGTSHDLAVHSTAVHRTEPHSTAPHSAPAVTGLQTALLTPEDLPAGYSVQPSASGSSIGDSSLSGCAPLATDPVGMTASAGVNLTGSSTQATISETLEQMASGDDAVKAMARFATMPASCHSFTGTILSYHVTFSAEPLPIPALGDQTVAARVTGNIAAAATVDIDVVVIRHHSTLIVVLDVGLTANAAFTKQIAARAYSKAAALP